jgi:hypothetical protein
VSLSNFLGFGQDYVERNYRRTGNAVYLHIRRKKKEVSVIFTLLWQLSKSSSVLLSSIVILGKEASVP